MASQGEIVPADGARAPTFFGEPVALGYLAFTEAWERFSYYGMSALVVLYMTETLFLPGHIETVVGFATLRGAIEGVTGPLTGKGLASMIYGLYSGLICFTPLFGGLLADRVLGARATVVIGALMLCAGHLALAFDASFLLGLLLLILGCGCVKGNVAARPARSIRATRRRRAPERSCCSTWASIPGSWPARSFAASWPSSMAGTQASAARR